MPDKSSLTANCLLLWVVHNVSFPSCSGFPNVALPRWEVHSLNKITTAHCSKLQFDFESKTRHMPATRNDFISKHFNVTSSLPLLQSCLPWLTLHAFSLLLPTDLKAQSPNESADDQKATKHGVSQQEKAVYRYERWIRTQIPHEILPKNAKKCTVAIFPTFFMPLRSWLYCPSGKAVLEAAPTWAASVQDTPGLPIAA